MAEQNAKITDEQLKEIQETQGKVNQILNQIGFVEVQKSALKVEFSKANEAAEDVKKKLEEEYGPINIDLASGEYTIVEQKKKNKVNNVVRKISIGSDYKNDAMHYSIGQQVYGGHEIAYIIHDTKDSSYNIHIKKGDEILPWKKFNSNMAISIEYDLEY